MVEPKKKETFLHHDSMPLCHLPRGPLVMSVHAFFSCLSWQIWTHQHINSPTRLPFIGVETRGGRRTAYCPHMDLEGHPSLLHFHMPAEWEPHSQCWLGWPVSFFYCFPSQFSFIPSLYSISILTFPFRSPSVFFFFFFLSDFLRVLWLHLVVGGDLFRFLWVFSLISLSNRKLEPHSSLKVSLTNHKNPWICHSNLNNGLSASLLCVVFLWNYRNGLIIGGIMQSMDNEYLLRWHLQSQSLNLWLSALVPPRYL